jgi:hypothetical protein
MIEHRSTRENRACVKRSAAFIFVLALVVTLAGCTLLKQPTSWMFANDSGAIYLSWTDANGTLAGTAQSSAAGDASTSTGDPVTTTSVQLSGTEADGKISLRLGGSILGTSVSGTIDNGSLVLQVPDPSGGGMTSETFRPASPADFNTKVSEISTRVQSQRRAAAAAQANATLAAQLDVIPDEVSNVQAASSALVSATSTAQSAASHLKDLTSAALVTGCSDSHASNQAVSASQSTATAGYALSSAATDQTAADSYLSSTLASLPDLGTLPQKDQDLVTNASRVLSAAESAANAASSLGDSVQSAANDSGTSIYSLPYC